MASIKKMIYVMQWTSGYPVFLHHMFAHNVTPTVTVLFERNVVTVNGWLMD